MGRSLTGVLWFWGLVVLVLSIEAACVLVLGQALRKMASVGW